MPHFRTINKSSESLNASNLDDNKGGYREVTVKIERVAEGIVKTAEEPNGKPMWMAYFVGVKKPLGLNMTNCTTLAGMSGSPKTESWVGLIVTLYVKRGVKAYGTVTDAIRIKKKAATGPVDASQLKEEPVTVKETSADEESPRTR